MGKHYYSLFVKESEADITIYGDITSYPIEEYGDVSSYNLSKKIGEMDVDTINVHINSYGGEVAEGLAIYNALRNHKAKVKTYCDGFACSIASVIFMAGDVRVMSKASILMIHNAWTMAVGNANDLRKEADTLDKITQTSVNAYLEHVNISEKQLKKMLDAETWLSYAEALEMGFATYVSTEEKTERASQSAKQKVFEIVMAKAVAENDEPVEEPTEPTVDEPTVDEPVEDPTVNELVEEPTDEPTIDAEGDKPAEHASNNIKQLFNFLI